MRLSWTISGATFMKLGRAPTTWRIFMVEGSVGTAVPTVNGRATVPKTPGAALYLARERGAAPASGAGRVRRRAQLRGLDARRLRGREAAAARRGQGGAHAARQGAGAPGAHAALPRDARLARPALRLAQAPSWRPGRAAGDPGDLPGRRALGGRQTRPPRAPPHRALPPDHADARARHAAPRCAGQQARPRAPARPRDQRPRRLRP